jgi:predicted flap endonuclease-1-like 5' DNA nuclease
MRLDYISYAVAIVFFIVTLAAVVYSTAVEQQVWVVTTVVIGLAFIGVGYTQRPRPAAAPQVTTSAPPPPQSQPQPQQDQFQTAQQQQAEIQQQPPQQQQPEPLRQPEQQPSEVTTAIAQPTVTDVVKLEELKPTVEPAVEPVPPLQPTAGGLTDVKGIGEKRASQLRALGILSVEDLSKASAKDLAARLKISPKITDKWIQNAREIGQKQ